MEGKCREAQNNDWKPVGKNDSRNTNIAIIQWKMKLLVLLNYSIQKIAARNG